MATRESVFSRIVEDRHNRLSSIQDVSHCYLIDAILQTILGDICSTIKYPVLFSCADGNIYNELCCFSELFDIGRLITDITKDLVEYGEYFLRLKADDSKKHGLLRISDDVEQTNIVAVYKNGCIDHFLVKDSNAVCSSALISDFAHFILRNNKLHISDEVYAVIGIPLAFGRLEKIKQLRDIEEHPNKNTEPLRECIADIRRLICTDMGVPYTMVYSTEDLASDMGVPYTMVYSTEDLASAREAERYVRLLGHIRKAIARGIKHIALIHLTHLNGNMLGATEKSFEVNV